MACFEGCWSFDAWRIIDSNSSYYIISAMDVIYETRHSPSLERLLIPGAVKLRSFISSFSSSLVKTCIIARVQAFSVSAGSIGPEPELVSKDETSLFGGAASLSSSWLAGVLMMAGNASGDFGWAGPSFADGLWSISLSANGKCADTYTWLCPKPPKQFDDTR
jgi:hypothetical protein